MLGRAQCWRARLAGEVKACSWSAASAGARDQPQYAPCPPCRYDVLVCTPLRLVSLLKKGALSLAKVSVLVLDEADKLLELGFLEQVPPEEGGGVRWAGGGEMPQ